MKVVSHDRDFLNWVVTDIIHLHKLQLHYYKGDYDTFEKVTFSNDLSSFLCLFGWLQKWTVHLINFLLVVISGRHSTSWKETERTGKENKIIEWETDTISQREKEKNGKRRTSSERQKGQFFWMRIRVCLCLCGSIKNVVRFFWYDLTSQVYKVKFTFEDPGPLSIPVIQIKDVSFGYSPDKLLFKNVKSSFFSLFWRMEVVCVRA